MGLNIAKCTIGLKSPGGNRGASKEALASLLEFFTQVKDGIEGAGRGDECQKKQVGARPGKTKPAAALPAIRLEGREGASKMTEGTEVRIAAYGQKMRGVGVVSLKSLCNH